MSKEPSLRASPQVRRARALLIAMTLFWGLSFPLLRGLQLAQVKHVPQVPDSLLACADTAMRFACAALIFFPFYARNLCNVTSREWGQALGLALLASAGLYLQTIGLIWTDASISAFLTQLYTLVVPLIIALRDRRLPSARVFVACALVLGGAAIMTPGLLSHFILGPGEFVTIVGSVFFAAQIVWLDRPLYGQNRAGVVTFLMFVMMALLFLGAYFLMGGTLQTGEKLVGTPVLGGLMLALILFCTVFNFFIINAWQHFISATEAGLIYSLEPLVAAIISSFFPAWISRLADIHYPNESLRWSLLIGGGLIIGATVLVATQPRDQVSGPKERPSRCPSCRSRPASP